MWGKNISIHHRKISWEVVNWMQLTRNRVLWWVLVLTEMNLQFP
jgi:hypothetical protein